MNNPFSGLFSNLRGDANAALILTVNSVPYAIGLGLISTSVLGSSYALTGALMGITGLIATTLVPAFTGGSRFQFSIPGPAAAGILGGLAANIAHDPKVLALAGGQQHQAVGIAITSVFLCSATVGVIHVLLGQFRLGNLIKLVPQTVITGILNGIVVMIALNQLPPLMGIEGSAKLISIASHLSVINPWCLLIGASVLAAVLVARRVKLFIPPILAGMVTGTLVYLFLSRGLHISGLGKTIGAMPAGLPVHFQVMAIARLVSGPALAAVFTEVFFAAIAIAIVTAIGALVTASSADTIARTRHNPVGELTGLGVGNVTSALLGGLPGGGSPSNVLINYNNGGRTRMSHVLTTLFCILVVVALGPAMSVIPLSVIAASLIIMSFDFFDRWPILLARKVIATTDQSLRRDLLFNLALMLVVMGLIVTSGLVTAIVAGLIMELLNFLLKSSKTLVRAASSGDLIHSNVVRDLDQVERLTRCGHTIRIISLQGTLFFGNTDYLSGYLDALPEEVNTVVLDFKRISDMDTSGILVLKRIDQGFTGEGKTLLFASLPPDEELYKFLVEYGLQRPVLENRVFDDTNTALAAAEDLLLESAGFSLMSSRQELPLGETIALRGMSEAQLTELELERKEFPAGDNIINEHDEANGLYVLVRGRVNIQKRDPVKGKVITLVNFGPGVNVGEMALLGSKSRTASVVATEPSVLYFLSVDNFNKLKETNPGVLLAIVSNIAGSLSRRLAEASETIMELESS